jgi:putative transposase
MPNHWHLVLWPRNDGELSTVAQWLTVTHVRRWHAHRHSEGTGPIYQGRFKSFPVQEDDHYFRVCRYVERNALRAKLVTRAEHWRWSSLWHRVHATQVGWLSDGPFPWPANWIEYVNGAETEAELSALRQSVVRGAPYGNEAWQKQTAAALGLESALRRQGRPKKKIDP